MPKYIFLLTLAVLLLFAVSCTGTPDGTGADADTAETDTEPSADTETDEVLTTVPTDTETFGTDPETAPNIEPDTSAADPETTPDSPAVTTPPVTTPVTKPVTAPVTKPVTEPVTTPVTEPVTKPVTTPVTEPKPEPERPKIVFNDLNALQKLTTPFWQMNTMYRESTCMIVRSNGTITAKLAFKPTRIIAVEDNALTKTYQEGKDYTWDGKSNTLVWLNGSSIPYFTQYDIEGKRADGTQIPEFGTTDPVWDELGRSRFGNALYCVSSFLYEKQIAVTYEYEYGTWNGTVTPYQGDKIPNTMAKLKAGETVNVVFYGDSIFTGCDSSSMYNRAPMQESFPSFTKQVLEATYGARVELYNPSVGGKSSDWGLENVQSLICDRVRPDLVIIGFGMNDGDKPGSSTALNIRRIIEKIRGTYPDCEFIIVAPMVPNVESGFLTTQGDLPQAYSNLAANMKGVAYVDMYNCHSRLLKKKDFISMSGNNINHPNDWLIRVYAMQILSALIEY